MTQLTGVTGQLGAIIAAVPMTVALRDLGWTKSYLIAASLGVVLTIALVIFVRDAPAARSLSGAALSLSGIRRSLGASWAQPGTRLGFWMHFTTQFSATTFGLLWGYPFFVRGEGRSDHVAGLLLTLMVVAVMSAGPVLGWAITRHPWQRSTIVLGIIGAMVAVWTVVLAWQGPAPTVLLVLLVIVMGVGGPASMIGFDLARTSNPADRLGSATAIVNQAGFVASLVLGRGDRPDPRLAHPRLVDRLHAVGIPLGDVVPVRPVVARPDPDLALPGQGSRQDHGGGARGVRPDPRARLTVSAAS